MTGTKRPTRDYRGVQLPYREWLYDGQRHRLSGPAVEADDGSKSWWHHGAKTWLSPSSIGTYPGDAS
jgi:hypothetical protein